MLKLARVRRCGERSFSPRNDGPLIEGEGCVGWEHSSHAPAGKRNGIFESGIHLVPHRERLNGWSEGLAGYNRS